MAKMTIHGIGSELAILSMIYGLPILIVNYIYLPELTFTLGLKIVNILIGSLFIIMGFGFVRKALTIIQYFKEKKLCTEGLYSKIRHPIHFAWIMMIIPGLVIITGLLLGFTIPFFMYLIFRIFIHREEDYLEELFGDAYREYKKSTRRFFPSFPHIK
ncbi:MAG: methyltransferase family protein [Promethearchaeota archaeon]